jgi:hypothetical protein
MPNSRNQTVTHPTIASPLHSETDPDFDKGIKEEVEIEATKLG